MRKILALQKLQVASGAATDDEIELTDFSYSCTVSCISYTCNEDMY